MSKLRITVWNEFLHENQNDLVRSVYPDGIHMCIKRALEARLDAVVNTATLRQAEHGLGGDVLENTDVLFWWGHIAHDEVDDAVVARVQEAVLGGMGLVVLHSGHVSKIFKRMLGTHGSLKWREADERERLWNLQPAHPLLEGVPETFVLEPEEMYGERFDVPTPDELLMLSWFQGGEVFRSLCTWRRGHGMVVYFRPGHEAYPTYKNEHVQRILANAAAYARRRTRRDDANSPNATAFEAVPNPGKEHVG